MQAPPPHTSSFQPPPPATASASNGYSHHHEYQDAAAATAAAALSHSQPGLTQHPASFTHGTTPAYGTQGAHPYGNPSSALGQPDQHVPTPSAQAAASANGRKRKASGVPGSRGVANLTPEQLAKKRANDREAQRAIRERTRNTIETLDQRIRDLEGQQPYQELQRVAMERDQALRECDDLRRKLAQVVNVAAGAPQQQQPNLHGTFDLFDEFIESNWLTDDPAELAALTAQQSPLPPLSSTQSQSQHASPQVSSGAAGSPFEQQQQHHIDPDLRSPHAAQSSQAGTSSHTATPGLTYHHETAPLRKWPPGVEQQREQQPQYTPTSGMSYEQHRSVPAPMQPHSNGERHGLNFLLDQTQSNHTPPPNAHVAQSQHNSQHG